MKLKKTLLTLLIATACTIGTAAQWTPQAGFSTLQNLK